MTTSAIERQTANAADVAGYHRRWYSLCPR
jgi:hypothetical protein